MARLRPASAYQHPRAPLRVLATDERAKLRRAFKTALRLPRRLFDAKQGADLIRAGRTGEVAAMVDWDHWREVMRHPAGRLAEVWLQGAKIGSERINRAFARRGVKVRFQKSALAKDYADQFNFDRFDPGTVERLRAYQDQLIAELEAEARTTIDRAVMDGTRAGKTPEQIADDIQAVVSLTERQAQAVLNYRNMLQAGDPEALTRALASPADRAAFQAAIASGDGLGADAVDAMTERYREAYIDYRAQTIAQTEATRAASLGLQDSYQQAIDRGAMPPEAVRQFWQVALDERTCPICLSIVDSNPDGVAMGAPFQSELGPVSGPPVHVNCRCSLELVTNLDLIPEGETPEITGPAAAYAVPGIVARGFKAADAMKTAWADASSLTSIEEALAKGALNQERLAVVAQEAADLTGATWKNPGIKHHLDRIAVEVARYDGQVSRVTDIVRGGFIVTSPDQADALVAELARKFEVIDEGWKRNAQDYFDRTVLVRFADGQIGEVQFWAPEIAQVKSAIAHEIYKQWRLLDPTSPEALALEAEMRRLYQAAVGEMSPDWNALFGSLTRS